MLSLSYPGAIKRPLQYPVIDVSLICLVSQLQNIKTRFEAELTRKSRSRVVKAEDRLRTSDMLHREIGELIEETLVGLSCRKALTSELMYERWLASTADHQCP